MSCFFPIIKCVACYLCSWFWLYIFNILGIYLIWWCSLLLLWCQHLFGFLDVYSQLDYFFWFLARAITIIEIYSSKFVWSPKNNDRSTLLSSLQFVLESVCLSQWLDNVVLVRKCRNRGHNLCRLDSPFELHSSIISGQFDYMFPCRKLTISFMRWLVILAL